MKEIFELDDLVREFKLEFSSFKEKGNKSAGTRARKKLSELAKYCATVRKAIQEELHNALADCYYQAKCIQSTFKHFGVKK